MSPGLEAGHVRLFADPLRVRLVELLAGGPLCTCHLVERTGAKQPTVSHHLRILKEAGVVDAEPSGAYTYYRLLPAPLAELGARFAALARTAASPPQRRPTCEAPESTPTTAEGAGDLADQAAVYRALGDPTRLAIVELVAMSDRTPGELRERTGLDWNLLGFHLRTLEAAGVVERQRSEGDRRRRYVRLLPGVLDRLDLRLTVSVATPLFVCTHNSARSQFAAALWTSTTGLPAGSAGSDPAAAVHRLAVEVAASYGLDLTAARPRPFTAVDVEPDVVVSVCDRATEGVIPFAAPRLHWSVADPSAGDRPEFEAAFADIAERVGRLAAVAA